ncbi:hypothetical protein VE23_19095 [Paenibacillus sp. D9]|nr:hypothetical protein VE23_19095 [Paenibacillus sp. D9]
MVVPALYFLILGAWSDNSLSAMETDRNKCSNQGRLNQVGLENLRGYFAGNVPLEKKPLAFKEFMGIEKSP